MAERRSFLSVTGIFGRISFYAGIILWVLSMSGEAGSRPATLNEIIGLLVVLACGYRLFTWKKISWRALRIWGVVFGAALAVVILGMTAIIIVILYTLAFP